jgi:archaellum component FlaC
MGGLQKLSDELRAERQKATTALQEKARLKIEVETLKSRMELTMKEAVDSRDSSESNEVEKRSLRTKIKELEGIIAQVINHVNVTRDMYIPTPLPAAIANTATDTDPDTPLPPQHHHHSTPLPLRTRRT